ncbi:MAG: DoxX family protein [Archangiaceae bacterium]|nr:DoxX family protein [Archangiaceae bacterium]
MRTELAGLFASGFLAIFFLHSGLDHALDRKASVTRLKAAFEATPMRRTAGAWLTLLTLGEMFAGVVSAAGCLALLFSGGSGMAFAGAVLGSSTLLFLFFGLRLGRDYAAASATVPYFVTCLAALVLLRP